MAGSRRTPPNRNARPEPTPIPRSRASGPESELDEYIRLGEETPEQEEDDLFQDLPEQGEEEEEDVELEEEGVGALVEEVEGEGAGGWTG